MQPLDSGPFGAGSGGFCHIFFSLSGGSAEVNIRIDMPFFAASVDSCNAYVTP